MCLPIRSTPAARRLFVVVVISLMPLPINIVGLMVKEKVFKEGCKSRTQKHPASGPPPPFLCMCDLLSDSPRLKDTEDGVKEVSRV